MLCRRCGMESSTTDVCEWCKRPMLPPGATVSAEAAKELKRNGRPIVQPPEASDEESPGLPLVQQPPEQEEAEPDLDHEDNEAPPPDAGGSQLRPLGGGEQETPASSPSDPTPPTHGLSEDATETSIDISQYLGADQSIFRPIVREGEAKSGGTDDLLKGSAPRSAAAAGDGPQWSENERLIRCLVAGLAASLAFALAQLFITGDTVNTLYMSIPIGRADNLLTALKYGIASGVIFGFGLGALLVRFQKGPALGAIAGLLVGLSLQNTYWSIIPGVIVGVICGRIATLGIRRVVNV